MRCRVDTGVGGCNCVVVLKPWMYRVCFVMQVSISVFCDSGVPIQAACLMSL